VRATGQGFHAPTLFEISPAHCRASRLLSMYVSNFTQSQIEERQIGNPDLRPEVAYEWSYGLVYSPKWLKGLTISATGGTRHAIDCLDSRCAISLSRIISPVWSACSAPSGAGPAPNGGPDLGPITLVIDPNDNLAGAVLEGLDYELIYYPGYVDLRTRRFWPVHLTP